MNNYPGGFKSYTKDQASTNRPTPHAAHINSGGDWTPSALTPAVSPQTSPRNPHTSSPLTLAKRPERFASINAAEHISPGGTGGEPGHYPNISSARTFPANHSNLHGGASSPPSTQDFANTRHLGPEIRGIRRQTRLRRTHAHGRSIGVQKVLSDHSINHIKKRNDICLVDRRRRSTKRED